MGRESTVGSVKRPYSVVVASGGGQAGSLPTRSSAAFEIDVNQVCEVVAPLPKQVRERWNEWGTCRGEDSRDAASLEDITARLESARRRREEFQRWVMLKQARSSPRKPSQEELRAVRAKKLEEKLAAAEQNRLSTLEAVRLKAAAMHQRTEVVAERVNERQDVLAQKLLGTLQAAETRRLALQEAEKERLSAAHQLVFSRLVRAQQKDVRERESVKEGIAAKLVQADALREARLAAAAAKAGSKVRHAKHVSKMRRLNEERCSELKRLVLDSKLQTAADRRREGFSVRAAVNAEKSETQFLKRQATTREKLRRQGSSRRLQQFWRTFRESSCTTHRIARAFVDQGVTFMDPGEREEGYKSDDGSGENATEPAVMVGGPTAKVNTHWRDPFEEFASRLQSQGTISAAKKLLTRLETRLTVKTGGTHECTALLRRLFPKAAKKGKIERYPTRVFLCAYMILNHPEVVFNRKGDREAYLSSAAKDMIDAFERVLEKIIIPGGGSERAGYSSANDSSGGYEPLQRVPSTIEWDVKVGDNGEHRTVGDLLIEFDTLWVSYLEQFVAWKSHDAAGLEAELIGMAVELETSMLRKCHGDPRSPRVQQNSDLQAVVSQVAHDNELLRERIHRLTGHGGVHRLDMALMHARDIIQSEVASFVSETEESESDSSSSRSQGRRRGHREGQRPSLNEIGPGPESRKQGNEALLWELLYDPGWKFPAEAAQEELRMIVDMKENMSCQSPIVSDAAGMSVAEVGEILQKEVQRIANKAFWDSMEEKLASGTGGADEQLLNMLVEIGIDLAEVLPKRASDEVREIFDKSELEHQLLSGPGAKHLGGLDTNGVLRVIEHASNFLKVYGAPARDEQAIHCHQTVRAEIMDSLAEAGPAKTAKLAKAVTRAMRLLVAQLKILRLDVANVRLKILADSMPLTSAVKYVQDRFSTTFGLEARDVDVGLPKTKEWLMEVVPNHQDFRNLLHEVLDGEEAVHPDQVPVNMQAGIQPSGRRPSGSAPATSLVDEVFLGQPSEIDGWQACVRIGLAQIISGERPALPENLPETLQLDSQRLHKSQDTFQKLLVMAAAILILQEHKRRMGAPLMESSEIKKVKERLSVVLSDPLMKLPSLTTELAQLAGSPQKETEDSLHTALMSLIASDQENSGFRSMSTGLCKALVILLVAGPSNKNLKARSALRRVLARIGAVPIMDDVIALSEGLACIARVSEAVYALWYSELCKRVSLIP